MTKNIKAIPEGLYCYENMGIEYTDDGFIMHIKPCCYYIHGEELSGVCDLLNMEVVDQCKICGINENIDG